jgi:membrane-associated phospholipid phosphatase
MRFSYFYLIDLVTLLMCGVNILAALLIPVGGKGRSGGSAILRRLGETLLFGGVAAGILLLCELTNEKEGRLWLFARYFYAFPLYSLFFKRSISLSQRLFRGRSLDSFFARLDARLFGPQPTLRMHAWTPEGGFVDELLAFGYFVYYVLLVVGWWLLFGLGRTDEALYGFTIVTISHYLLYIFYVFFPVQGPKYYFPKERQRIYERLDGLVFTSYVKKVFGKMNLAGAAFPSSHVALSLLSLFLYFQSSTILGVALVPLVLLVFVSTVYVFSHYVVDSIAGLAVGVVLFFLLPRLVASVEPALAVVDAALGAAVGLSVIG